MIRLVNTALDRADAALRHAHGNGLGSARARAAAWVHVLLLDHGLLRGIWTNRREIAPGVICTNQPSPARLHRFARAGGRSVLSLRGRSAAAHHLLEEEACATAGLRLYTVNLQARKLACPARYLDLLDLFGRIERPLLIHCKSGADRTGLAAALYLMHVGQVPVEQARRQLALRYLHNRASATGILDHMLDRYTTDTADTPLPIREWFETRYDPQEITESWEATR
ncbi:tyrosine phosphatase family protein [Rhodovulum imhoffii]|uniref:Tyrosine phosphatase family protein n=1 Tax=Rhodovulum imhoffii TaxID=365340 RepID=A0A2T5BR52_9RHOB|nr:tyrosine-protein phosphatase [Rhodovulum imhoffii]MBK5934967.1 hypothetical protein [Rhodovulum imhoffii]PTN01682.1 tyrosine phosphatase family protein [Rhodovulum imhoffii]